MDLTAVCSECHSRFCLVRSPDICITLHRERKALSGPPADKMVHSAAVEKSGNSREGTQPGWQRGPAVRSK